MQLNLFAVAWIAGLPGIVVIALLPLPVLVADRALPVFVWVALAPKEAGAVSARLNSNVRRHG